MTKEELATERNEVREILEDFSEELSQSNLDKLSRVFCIINSDEKRIAELEKDKQYFSDSLDKQIEATLKLDKENEELDCQKNRNKFCYSCANATERCFRNEIGCPCDKYKSYKDENAELENDYKLIDKSREHLVQEKYNLEYKIENLENKIEHHQEVINTLQKKNAELKDYRLTTLAKQQTGMSKYALNLEHKLSWYDEQLTKAKDHIKKLLDCLKQDTNDPQTNYYVCQYMDKAEQFLSEVEK
jgi:chromosome segregation ATPase